MLIVCRACGSTFDDKDCWTTCPHERLMSVEDAKRKDAATALFGRQIRFAHQPDGPWFRIRSVNYIGMVTITHPDMEGEFAPHLFVPEEPQ